MNYRLNFSGLMLGLSFLLSSCNVNLFQPVVKPDSDRALLEEARMSIDDQNYSAALSTLDKVAGDSNELRLLRSTARLGASGLNMWSILLDIVDSDSTSSTSSGADSFFDQISGAVVGENEVKVARLAALTSSIEDLLAAPDRSASRVKNLACFLAGIMALPTITDATNAITGISTSLELLAANVDVQNPNAECPDMSNFNSSLVLIGSAQTQFRLIFDATSDCKLLDTTGSASELNAIETQMAKFNGKADAGCSTTPACGSAAACKALSLGCVYTALNSGDASVAADGKVTKCELVQNCLTPGTCF